MHSWHFLEGHLIRVTDGGRQITAICYEGGILVEGVLPPLESQVKFVHQGSMDCQHACVDAIYERRANSGFRTAQDALARVTNRFGESIHEHDGRTIKIERESNGDLLAHAMHSFDSLALRLRKNGMFEEPEGISPLAGFDPAGERMYQAMKRYLLLRRDWEMTAALAD